MGSVRLSLTWLVWLAWLVWLIVLSGYDIRQRRLPNWLTLPGAAAALLVAGVAGRGMPALAGAAGLGAVYLLVHLAAPAALGAGDVKLALGVGALTGFLGAEVWMLAALAAPLLTAVWALVAMALRVEPRVSGARGVPAVRSVPHGPSMCLASGVAAALAVC